MRAIRAVNPEARLIATDDLGFCHATPPLQGEADYQNERRWMGWDLLCGMVKPGHALWERLVGYGLEDRLRVIAEDPCPPAVIGVNHYLASERLLDHRVELHGDRSMADRELGELNGVQFVDVDAVRNLRTPMVGLPELLRQAWRRYGLPVAVTECHNGASREEQVRWFVEVWDSVVDLRREGVDVPAVTAWSLLGSHDWNRMVTRFIGHYEVGVYDVRSGTPRRPCWRPVLKDSSPAVGRRRWAWASPAGGAARPASWTPARRARVRPGPGRAGERRRPPPAAGGYGEPLPAPAGPRLRSARAALPPRADSGPRAAAGDPPLGRDRRARLGRGLRGSGRPSGARQPVRSARSAGGGLRGGRHALRGVHRRLRPREVDERLLELGGPRLLLGGTERVFMPWDRSRFAVQALDALDFGLPVSVNPASAGTRPTAPT
jgi:dTDP-4-dehydrorhamnose reductase